MMRTNGGPGNTSSEKERLKREEEENRRRQYAYEMQVSDKRNQLRKDFELFKSTEAFKPTPSQLPSSSSFIDELNRLQDLNSKKEIELRKLQMNLAKDISQTSGISLSHAITGSRSMSPGSSMVLLNKTQHQQLNQHRSGMRNNSMANANANSTNNIALASSGMHATNSKLFPAGASNLHGSSISITQQQTMNSESYARSRQEDINANILTLESKMFSESEQYQSLLNMQKELTHSLNQFKEKVNHLKRMNDIADTRYKDIRHIDVQANENKRQINWNVEQAKEQITNVEMMYKSYRQKKSEISQSLKQENEQEENFLSDVQIKIEECIKQNEGLQQEIDRLDMEFHKRDLRQKESYFIGLYLWAFEQLEKFISAVNAKNTKGIEEIDDLIDTNEEQLTGTLGHENNHNLNLPNSNTNSTQGLLNLQDDEPIAQLGSRYRLPIPSKPQSRLQTPSKGKQHSQQQLSQSQQQQQQQLQQHRSKQKKSHQQQQHQQLLSGGELNDDDDYEVEAPQFDRSEVLQKINQYYRDHGDSIIPTIENISGFFKDMNIQNLLLKNQYENLIEQKQLLHGEIVGKEAEITTLKENNFFLHKQDHQQQQNQNQLQQGQKHHQNLTHSHSEQLNQQSKSQSKHKNKHLKQQQQQQTQQEQQQLQLEKESEIDRKAIVDDFLSQTIAMDSGIILKNSRSNPNLLTHISTVNVERFHNPSSESTNQEALNEKQQKFVFNCYLGIVELVKRLCVIVPLVENRIENLQTRLNIFFNLEYVPASLLKACTDLFYTATNGKSLESEFIRINESATKPLTSTTNGSTALGSILPPPTHPLMHRNSVIMHGNTQSALNGSNFHTHSRRSHQSQQLSYLNLDEIANLDRSSNISSQDRFSGSVHQNNSNNTGNNVNINIQGNDDDPISAGIPLPTLNPENRSLSTQPQSLQNQHDTPQLINSITSYVMNDKIAKYLMHEHYVRRFVKRYLDHYTQQSQSQQQQQTQPAQQTLKNEILVAVKTEAMSILNNKTASIFKQYSGVHEQLRTYISAMKKTLLDRRGDARPTLAYGSNHPPSIGGVLSLPRSDYIIRSYYNAYDKQLKYSRNEEEDCLQVFAKVSSTQADRDSLILSHQQTSSIPANDSGIANIAPTTGSLGLGSSGLGIGSNPTGLNAVAAQIAAENQKNAIYKFISDISAAKKNKYHPVIYTKSLETNPTASNNTANANAPSNSSVGQTNKQDSQSAGVATAVSSTGAATTTSNGGQNLTVTFAIPEKTLSNPTTSQQTNVASGPQPSQLSSNTGGAQANEPASLNQQQQQLGSQSASSTTGTNQNNNTGSAASAGASQAGGPTHSQSIKQAEDDYIEEERKQIKITERKEFDDFRFKHIREHDLQQQEEKKKRIVYHRLITNAETDHSRQEHSAIKQFALDTDILFKISNLEGQTSNVVAEDLNDTIKQESTKLGTKYAKEFSKLSKSYLKMNTIYNVRKEMSTRDRQRLKNNEYESKYYLHSSGNSKHRSDTDNASRMESAQSRSNYNFSSQKANPSQSQQQLTLHRTSDALMNSSGGFMHSQGQNGNLQNNQFQEKPKTTQSNRRLPRQPQFNHTSASIAAPATHSTSTTVFQSGGKSYSISSQDLNSQFFMPLPALSNSNYNTNGNGTIQFARQHSSLSGSSIIMPQNGIISSPSSTIPLGQANVPVHFKYLQPEWNFPHSMNGTLTSTSAAQNLFDLPQFSPAANGFNNGLSGGREGNASQKAHQNFIRKAFTSQSSNRNKIG